MNHYLFSRRQFIKYGSATALSFAGVSLGELGQKSARSQVNNGAISPAIAALEKDIPGMMEQAVIPGIAIALIKNAEVVWSQGFGVKDNDSKDPVHTHTVFSAASLSKPIFAYAVMKMCEQGKLELDTPLTEYTKKPYISDPRINLITTRMILSHTCGFPNWSGDDPLSIDFPPGSKFSYSSEGYIYLQSVVEGITQQLLNDYMTHNVFTPLRMTNSSYIWQKAYEFSAAKGHDRDGNPQPLSRPRQAVSAGSLRTTVIDFAKFLIAMMESRPNDPFELEEKSLNLMVHENIKISQHLGWGLGWGVEHTPNGDFFWHWGDSGIFKCITFGSKQHRSGIVILTNSANGLKICEEIVTRSLGGQHIAFDFRMIDY